MPLFPERRLSWRLACCVLVITLAGCVTTPPVPQAALDVAQQRALLLQLPRFSFTGGVGVSAPTAPDGGMNASVTWEQQQDLARVKLSSPFGGGSLQLEYSPTHLSLLTSRGVKLQDAEAAQVLERDLGFVPPFDALRYWIRGLPAPDTEAAIETRDAAGVLQQLQQHGWLIRYQGQMAVKTAAGSVQLPAKLTATRDEVRLRLVIHRWQLR